MKAVVWKGIGEIQLEDVPDPQIEAPTDAIVRITASAICGTDLHMIRGTITGMKPGTVLGHEGVGVVEQLGPDVRNFQVGDRVVIASTIACGICAYCRDGYYAQCTETNPNGPEAGTCFFGGPALSGPINGLQAELARVPFAHVGLIKLPEDVSDEQAIVLSDIFPTGYFGAEMADIKPGHTVAVFGCGPVGQFVIASLKLMDAGRIFAVDNVPSRLEMARNQGAEVINFDQEHPVQAIKRLTSGIGVDRAIDAVGVDANCAHRGPAVQQKMKAMFAQELKDIAPQQNPQNGNWHPGDGPSQVLRWAIEALARAGTLSVIGVYPESDQTFPLGMTMNKNLTVRMGNCNHRRYIPRLLEYIRGGAVDPRKILTNIQPLTSAIDAYKAFDRREEGWVKVELRPEMAMRS